MLKPANCLYLLIVLFMASCQQRTKTEKEETAFWNTRFIDSSYRLLYQDEDTARALRYFDALLSQSDDLSPYPKAARYTLLANYHYFFTTDNGATAAAIDSALAVYPSPELQNQYPQTYVSLLLFGGHMAYRLSRYSKANDYYFRAKRLADAHLSPCERTAFNYSIAMVLYRQENFRGSLHYFKQAFDLQETCTPQTTAVVLQQQEIQSNIGLCLIKLEQYDSAMSHFDRALAIANRYRDSLGASTMDKIEGVIAGNKAQVAAAKGLLREAEELSLKSIALNNRPGYEVENAMGVKLQLSELYGRKGDFARMASVLGTVGATVLQSNAKMRLNWMRLMASCDEQRGNKDAALQSFKRHVSLRDSLSAEQKLLTAADVARQLREKEQAIEIAVLKKDQHITQIILCVTIVFSCMALAILYLIFKNYRRSKKHLAQSLALNKEIGRQKAAREAEEKLRHKLITEAVISAQENERSLIGLELHDNVGQLLTSVKLQNEMLLEGVGDPKVILPKVLAYLQTCINEIRSLSKRLSAPTLGKISLEESVNDLIDSINETSKIKITRQIAGFDSGLLKKELHIGVYRILQEQLNNVLKHADATEVLVQLESHENTLHLLVSDNGKGFCIQQERKGIGLVNIQTRAENLNGKFELRSRPGKGCQLLVTIPQAN